MSLPSDDEIKDQLAFVREDLVAIVMKSWQRWLDMKQPDWTARGRANAVWEFMRTEAHERFSTNRQIRVLDEPLTVSYLVKGTLLFRFKKGGVSGLTANFPTQLAIAYHDQDQDLFGLPSVHRLEVVYVLKKPLEASIQDVLVIARNGDSIVRCFSLLSDEGNVVQLPNDTEDEVDGERKVGSKPPVITPKRAADEDEGEGSN